MITGRIPTKGLLLCHSAAEGADDGEDFLQKLGRFGDRFGEPLRKRPRSASVLRSAMLNQGHPTQERSRRFERHIKAVRDVAHGEGCVSQDGFHLLHRVRCSRSEPRDVVVYCWPKGKGRGPTCRDATPPVWGASAVSGVVQ